MQDESNYPLHDPKEHRRLMQEWYREKARGEVAGLTFTFFWDSNEQAYVVRTFEFHGDHGGTPPCEAQEGTATGR